MAVLTQLLFAMALLSWFYYTFPANIQLYILIFLFLTESSAYLSSFLFFPA